MKNFFLACFFTQTNLLPPRIFYSRKPTYLLLHFYLLMIQKNSNARSVRCSYLNQDEWEAPSFAEACGLRLRERHEASKRRKFHGNMGERERGWKKGINRQSSFPRKCEGREGRVHRCALTKRPHLFATTTPSPHRWWFPSQACSSFARATSTFIAPM